MSVPAFLPRPQLQQLFDVLIGYGYRVIGPVARDGAISYDEIVSASALPWGIRVHQEAGVCRLQAAADELCFAWANGPQGLKPLVFAPLEPLWRMSRRGESFEVEAVKAEQRPTAVLGVRACDLAALALQDKHFLGGTHVDAHYAARREGLFLVAVNCTHPAPTCFCASTGDGPQATSGYDLALTELDDGYTLSAGSQVGEGVLSHLALLPATPSQLAGVQQALHHAAVVQTRKLPGTNLHDVLLARLDHPRWQEVAERCLACGNCTAVCPTCFCHAETELAGLDAGSSTHRREWDSCFGERHGYIHGKQLRPATLQRYRQWLTHKLATWHDQYGRSGCVGCGRCIVWCPTGIDITEEAAALCDPQP